jgi:diguanylate cyclase (GGDEF)-like protein
MQFDTNTTLLATSAIIAAIGLQLLVFWLRDRQSPWFAWFSCSYLTGAVALLFYLLPGRHLEFLVFGGGNAARIAAFAFLWQANRRFAGRAPEFLVVALVVAIWLMLCSVPAFLATLDARVVGTGGLMAFFLLLGAWELWRDRAEALPSRTPTIVVYVSFAILILARVPLLQLAPFSMGPLPVNPGWLAAYSLVGFVHTLFIAGFTLSMTRERQELEQRKFALSDPLTGLLNRRAFLEQAKRASRRRWGGRDRVAMLVLDLDHFKSINDRFGHETGDQVLQNFADVVREATRAGDLLYRMGGEEFCFVLPGATVAEANIIAERIRIRFAESVIARGAQRVSATVSIGIAATDQASSDPELLLAAGDSALYRAKAAGRNRTVIADVLLTPRGGRPTLLVAA